MTQERVPPPGFAYRCAKCGRFVQTRSVGRRPTGELEHRAVYRREQCKGDLFEVPFTRNKPTAVTS